MVFFFISLKKGLLVEQDEGETIVFVKKKQHHESEDGVLFTLQR
jgi:hypothetical protein